jgi:hypothetical protein
MRRALAILLSAAVFSCPLFCTLGRCGEDAGDQGQRCSCCDHEGSSAVPEDGSRPMKPANHEAGGACQCICGGAVVEDASLDGVQLDVRLDLPVATILPAIIAAQIAEPVPSREVHLPDDGMNPGRALCCLYSTFLC